MEDETAVLARSYRAAEIRLNELSSEQKELFEEVLGGLQKEGFSIERMTPVWIIVSHESMSHKVQLGVDRVNLDSILILDDEELTYYPRGSFGNGSTTHLVKDNVEFSIQRIKAYFNLHDDKENDNNNFLYENVKTAYRYRELRDKNKQ